MSEFVWPVAVKGYAWKEAPGSPPDQLLVPAEKWPVRRYAPLRENSALFHKLAGTPPTPEDVLGFANQYGHLGTRTTHGDVEGADVFQDPDRFSDWKQAVEEMRTAIDLWQSITGGRAGEAEARSLQDLVNRQIRDRLSPSLEMDARRGGLKLDYQPHTLLGAIWLQFARAVAGNKKTRECRTCKIWFVLAPGEARTTRQFCSEACRSRSYRERKEEARNLANSGKPPKEIAEKLGSDVKTVKKWLKERSS